MLYKIDDSLEELETKREVLEALVLKYKDARRRNLYWFLGFCFVIGIGFTSDEINIWLTALCVICLVVCGTLWLSAWWELSDIKHSIWGIDLQIERVSKRAFDVDGYQ